MAVPIIIVMSMNGALGLADAALPGRYVGPHGLEAVTLIFPACMALSALGVLGGSSMVSILARLLGAGRHGEVNAVFQATHALALAIGGGLVVLYGGTGRQAIAALTGAGAVAGMAQGYFSILIFASPVVLILAAQSDALRGEGRMGFMAAGALLVSLSNIGFDYLLIAVLRLGVAGSALGMVAAQALALAAILTYRRRAGGRHAAPQRGPGLGLDAGAWRTAKPGDDGYGPDLGRDHCRAEYLGRGQPVHILARLWHHDAHHDLCRHAHSGPLTGDAIGDRHQSRCWACGPGHAGLRQPWVRPLPLRGWRSLPWPLARAASGAALSKIRRSRANFPASCQCVPPCCSAPGR